MEVNDIIDRERESWNMSLANKALQIKALEGENSQLRLEVATLKERPSLLNERPHSPQYTRMLEEKAQTIQSLQT